MTRVHHLIQTNGLSSNAAFVFVACEQRVEMWQEHGAHTCAASDAVHHPRLHYDDGVSDYGVARCFDIHGYV